MAARASLEVLEGLQQQNVAGLDPGVPVVPPQKKAVDHGGCSR